MESVASAACRSPKPVPAPLSAVSVFALSRYEVRRRWFLVPFDVPLLLFSPDFFSARKRSRQPTDCWAMRSPPVKGLLLLLLLCLTVVRAGEPPDRRRRFLDPDSWTFLPDSLPHLGDYARDLGDQIVAQASMAVQQMIPQVSRTLDSLAATPSRRRGAPRPEDVAVAAKRRRVVPAGRETEGDERDVEVFNPVRQDPKPNQDSEPDSTWFRPLVPFSFSFGLLTPWWEGPNVCVERSEVEEPEQEGQEFSGFNINFETTRCIPSDSSYICTKKIQSNGVRKTIIVRRLCCHGYIRRTDGRPGCAVLKMENVIDTLKTLEMERFIQWINNAGPREKLAEDNYTVFTPSNEAIMDYEDETEDNEISAIDPVKRVVDVSSLVRSHIVEGFVNADHLEDEQLLDTLKENVKIRINKYHPAHEIITANCIPMSGKNNFATNGIVHLISGVLPQPTKTVGEIIQADDQFTSLRKLLEDSGMMEELKKEGGQSWTLFAPTDDAFRKLPRVLKRQIESGEACVQNILHQHLVRGTVCTSAVINQIKIKNILDNLLHITRDEAEKLRVDGSVIDFENTLGTNGVIHAVEKVLIPPQAQSLMKALEEQEREDILRFIETANLVSELEEMRNITFFVPSKEAFQNLPNETLQKMESDSELVRKILLSHMVGSHMPTSVFADNRNFETLNGHNVHLKLQELFPGIVTGATVQCAHITSHDHQVCGAVIHKINKVLMPPKGNIVKTLKEMKGHDKILKMLQVTELDKKLEEGPFTFLAPPDEAFERFSDEDLKEMLENKTKAEEILKLHILPETLCCNSINHISPFHRQFVRTLDGSLLPLHRSLYDRVKFGRARAVHCDIQTDNGLIHSVSRVILPNRPTKNVFNMELWRF